MLVNNEHFWRHAFTGQTKLMWSLTKQWESRRQVLFFYFTGQTNLNDDQPGQPGEIQKEATETKMTTTLKGSMGERINKALAKVEEKKKKRAARRAQVCNLFQTSVRIPTIIPAWA